MAPDLIVWLKAYHFAVSTLAAFGAVMVMQVVGREWTSSWQNSFLQHFQRVGLATLSIALFCSGIRLPYVSQCGPIVLMSAAAVNTAIFIIMIPTAIMGQTPATPVR